MISGGNRPPAARPTRTSRAAASKKAKAEETTATKKVKTKLGRKELNHYRNLLLIKRAEVAGDLSAMEAEALRANADGMSHMPIHMADLGTDTYDQDFMLGLAETERERMREIDDALRRIQDRTYGVCELTGKPIPKMRLEAKPWARYTVQARMQLESGRGLT
jgi:RNA polymerase-binding transcription factor DksA